MFRIRIPATQTYQLRNNDAAQNRLYKICRIVSSMSINAKNQYRSLSGTQKQIKRSDLCCETLRSKFGPHWNVYHSDNGSIWDSNTIHTQIDLPTHEQWFSVTPQEQSVNILSSSIGVSSGYSSSRLPNKWRRSWSTNQNQWNLLLLLSGNESFSKESPTSYKTRSMTKRTESVSMVVAEVFAFVDHWNIRCFYATQNRYK